MKLSELKWGDETHSKRCVVRDFPRRIAVYRHDPDDNGDVYYSIYVHDKNYTGPTRAWSRQPAIAAQCILYHLLGVTDDHQTT